MAHERAGLPAQESDLINVDEVIAAYYDLIPDPSNPDQQVVFGTSGHRGSSLDGAFNEAHIVATTQAIVEYRRSQGIDGPLFIGRDTHALSLPAWQSALEVLAANDIDVRIDARDSYTPTPAVSHAILLHNGAGTSAGVRVEGPGLAEHTMRACDVRARIPMSRGTDSLNVATAAALAFYERARSTG